MEVGGCDLAAVAREFGTPLYVYDEETVRTLAREFRAAMGEAGHVLYSAKAFASPQFLRVVAEEGLGLDVVSAGELELALRSGLPAARVYFLGIAYTQDDDPPTPREFVTTLRAALYGGCAERGLPVPELVVEPGRSLAGPAGMALYTVGAIKEIPGVRTYAAVDGGMGDNIRPKLYGARYEAIKVDDPEPAERDLHTVTIAG